jgi:hypothetical protein
LFLFACWHAEAIATIVSAVKTRNPGRAMTAARSDDRLKGKVAIVTGAGSRGEGIGNGRATAVILARHGARMRQNG